MAASSTVHMVTLPRARLRRLAEKLQDLGPSVKAPGPLQHPIKVVCISDTHNHQPPLPPGEVLLHAGDLSEWGSFDEIQSQLSWLSSQPHKYTVVIAGNHDVLFDRDFLASEKERFPIKEGRTAADLDFGSVIYLQDSATTLDFPELNRKLTVYGSPWTPKHVKSAFQYERKEDVWDGNLPQDLDILLTHGPPYRHLDGMLHSGCPYLAQAIEGKRPRLAVFGHIHVGHGREKFDFDALRRRYVDIERG